ncbi:hypothetical protein AN958_06937 [Leucoagaricus sp. SymC.cos]|nr:hypothetical protein AN958_06937 [Leucoagaricus sp. SymC.cos]
MGYMRGCVKKEISQDPSTNKGVLRCIFCVFLEVETNSIRTKGIGVCWSEDLTASMARRGTGSGYRCLIIVEEKQW